MSGHRPFRSLRIKRRLDDKMWAVAFWRDVYDVTTPDDQYERFEQGDMHASFEVRIPVWLGRLLARWRS